MSKYGVFSGPYFPVFSPNKGKYGPEKILYLDTFHTVTMKFNGRYSHRIKGTAMGNPMAVIYANIFMSVFESNILLKYQNKYKCKSASWSRFIDIFYIWTSDEKSLKHFPDICNKYSNSKGMQCTIKFTYCYSTSTVNFLDFTIKVERNGTL